MKNRTSLDPAISSTYDPSTILHSWNSKYNLLIATTLSPPTQHLTISIFNDLQNLLVRKPPKISSFFLITEDTFTDENIFEMISFLCFYDIAFSGFPSYLSVFFLFSLKVNILYSLLSIFTTSGIKCSCAHSITTFRKLMSNF